MLSARTSRSRSCPRQRIVVSQSCFPGSNMSDCCAISAGDDSAPRIHRCPVNGLEYAEVSARTMAHHVREIWTWRQTAKRYFFCDDPACEVVYFGDDGSSILKSRLRTRLATKDPYDDDALICHCFGVSNRDFKTTPAIRDFVVAQTKGGRCSCDISNPSGRCCLKDFPRSAPE